MSDSEKPPFRLYRSESDRMLSGVAGGLAESLRIDSTLVRLLWVLVGLVTSGVGLLAYVAMWVIVPPRSVAETRAAAESGLAGPSEHAGGDAPAASEPDAGTDADSSAAPPREASPRVEVRANVGRRSNAPIIAGIALILLGGVLLVDYWVPVRLWSFVGDLFGLALDFWPIALIAAGGLLLYSRLRPGT